MNNNRHNTIIALLGVILGVLITLIGFKITDNQRKFIEYYYNDDLSLAESDLIKVVGRLPMGHGVTACGRFAVITKTGA